MGCSVRRAWEMIMLKAVQTIRAWLVKFQKEVCHGSGQLALEINSD